VQVLSMCGVVSQDKDGTYWMGDLLLELSLVAALVGEL